MNSGSCLNPCFAFYCACFNIPFHPQILSKAPTSEKASDLGGWFSLLSQGGEGVRSSVQSLLREEAALQRWKKMEQELQTCLFREKMKPQSNLMCTFQFFYAFTNTKITMAFIRKVDFTFFFLQLVLSLLACIDIPPPFSWLYIIPLCNVP